MSRLIRRLPALLLCLCILWLGGCRAGNEGTADPTSPPSAVSAATEKRYAEAEVREYQGIRLDPSVGPRDNSILGAQNVNLDTYTLSVTGLVDAPLSLTYDQVLAYPAYERLIYLYCVEGWSATILWEGVQLTALIDTAGPQGTANTVIFHCVDGYTTALPLDYIREKDLLLAYKSNGLTLPASLGFPFMVVAEAKLGYKWARWVSEIELSADEGYLGFWESRGYSNRAIIE